MWKGNKSQAGSLESMILDEAKWILGCSSNSCNEPVRGANSCNEPVRGDMGLHCRSVEIEQS